MIFDGHSDIWTDVTVRRCNGEKNVFDRLHYPRMHKGGVEGSIFVIWLDPPFDADPDKRLGEIATAIIEIKQGMTCSEEEINEFCLALPKYKRPRKIIFAEVPRNPTGKIEKPRLREMYCGGSLVEAQITG